jgi:hypothetical protein
LHEREQTVPVLRQPLLEDGTVELDDPFLHPLNKRRGGGMAKGGGMRKGGGKWENTRAKAHTYIHQTHREGKKGKIETPDKS